MLRLIYFAVSLLLSFTAFAQFPTEGYRLDNPYFLDSTLKDYDLFFTPEVHWDSDNSNRKKKMIEYLSSKYSLDIIVIERSYAFGHWINYFLETGDSLFLKEYLSYASFFSTRNGVVYENEYEFYRWLRSINLDNNLNIKVVGIDMASFWDGKPILWSFLKFTELNPELQAPLKVSIDKAKTIMLQESISSRDIFKWHRNLESYTSDLKVTNPFFLNYLYNLQQSVIWSTRRDVDYREEQIANNFMKYIKKGQKVYGQYGMGHTSLSPEKLIRSKPFKAFKPKLFTSFVSILNKQKPYQNRILSIGLVCFNCDKFDDYPGPDLFYPFLKQEEFDRLKQTFLKLPNGTIIDFRGSDETIKNYSQLILVEFD